MSSINTLKLARQILRVQILLKTHLLTNFNYKVITFAIQTDYINKQHSNSINGQVPIKMENNNISSLQIH